jgi:hypothetical protein
MLVMDAGALALLIPVLALAIGLIAIIKLPPRVLGRRASTPDLEARMQDLELEVNTLRQELEDAQQRLDFAERVIARNEEGRALPRGGTSA